MVLHRVFLVFIIMLVANSALAVDFYARLKLQHLQYWEEFPKLNPQLKGYSYGSGQYRHKYPFVRLEGKAEGYVAGSGRSYLSLSRLELAIRTDRNADVSGTLFTFGVPRGKWKKRKFKISAEQLSSKGAAKIEFLRAKSDHYTRLRRTGIPGGYWFRYQAHKAYPGRVNLGNNRRNTGFDQTIELASGRRAVAENLQLDRSLRISSGFGNRTVPIEGIRGIRVRAFEWAKRNRGHNPKLDRLAGLIPADQYALYCRSREILQANLNEANAYLAPLATVVGLRSGIADISKFYRHQLGLDIPALKKVKLRSIAITGSDPYLELGTDLAVLYECEKPQQIRRIFQQSFVRRQDVQFSESVFPGQSGIRLLSATNADRTVCSHVIVLDKVVVVSNSVNQLTQIVRTWQRVLPNMKSLEEYQFFRIRYPISDRSLLLVMTDQAIRKWCGPRWRIGNSRRLRAASELANIQASQLDALAKNSKVRYGKQDAGLGKITVGTVGFRSSRYGNLAFMTPILELHIDKVSGQERDAYVRWRGQYERRWRKFDPIALQVVRGKRGWKSDLTVMPLINNTNYNWLRQFAGKSLIGAQQGDHHLESLLHIIAAVDFKQNALSQPLSGVKAIEVYIDQDPLWKKIAERIQNGATVTALKPGEQLPLAIRFDVEPNRAKSVDMVIKRMLTGNGNWKKVSKDGLSYETTSNFVFFGQAYIASTSHSIVISTSERVIQRALNRTLGKRKQPNAKWLGKHLAVRLRPGGVKLITSIFRTGYLQVLQQQSFDALPILTEWKRRYPDKDPVALHLRLWHAKLSCPGGGKYVWNAKAGTMESTVFGHPAKPKFPKQWKTPLDGIQRIDLGATFEQDGLRAKIEVVR